MRRYILTAALMTVLALNACKKDDNGPPGYQITAKKEIVAPSPLRPYAGYQILLAVTRRSWEPNVRDTRKSKEYYGRSALVTLHQSAAKPAAKEII